MLKSIRTLRNKYRYLRKERAWEHSARRAELDAERDLPPRSLTDEEMQVLRWALEHGTEQARTYLVQIDGIRAVRSCTCGCPTIRLIPQDSVSNGSTEGYKILCDLEGRTSKGEVVGVLLFQNKGRLSELEAYSIDGQLESMEFEFPLVSTLQPLDVQSPSSDA